jgi:phosphatidylinositol 4-phosphatase
MSLVRSASLSETPSQFVLSAKGRDVDAPSLLIDRTTGAISVSDASSQNNNNSNSNAMSVGGRHVEALMGVIELLCDKYIVVCTKASVVGQLGVHKIKLVDAFEIIPLSFSPAVASPADAAEEKHYLYLLQRALAEPALYFCHTHDLTRSLRHRSWSAPEQSAADLLSSADERLWWNRHLLHALLTMGGAAKQWCTPMLKGFVRIVDNCKINGKSFTFALLSRRCRYRAGTRYNVRGGDAQGNVANEVETEQLVLLPDGQATSICLLRGSIPLRWSQFASIKYKPKPVLMGDVAQMRPGFQRHFERVVQTYGGGAVVAVNLIDQTGSEGPLAAAFEQMAGALARDLPLRYIGFDFHKECKKMKYERIDTLLDACKADIDKHTFTHAAHDGARRLSTQVGVVRVNCIDNLDRTNVVQSVFAKYSLEQQLLALGVLQTGQRVDQSPEFEQARKNAWADNANAVSMQYSGTGALKVDFTRTGKRSLRGVIDDGINSATRYVLNNFRDGDRQDSYDLLLGNYVPSKRPAGSKSPFKQTPLATTVYIAFFVLALLMLLVTSYRPVPPVGSAWLQKLLLLVVWALLLWATWKTALRYGKDLVQQPKLVLNSTR